MNDRSLPPLPHSRDTALSLAKQLLAAGTSVEVAADAIEREMQAYARRHALAAVAGADAATKHGRLSEVARALLGELQRAHRFLRKNGYDMTGIDAAIAKAEGRS